MILISVEVFRRLTFFRGPNVYRCLLIFRLLLYTGRGPDYIGYLVLLNGNFNLHLVFNDRFLLLAERTNRNDVRFLSASVLKDRLDLRFFGALDLYRRLLDREFCDSLRLGEIIFTILRRELRFNGLLLILFRLFASGFGIQHGLLLNVRETFYRDTALRVRATLHHVGLTRSL